MRLRCREVDEVAREISEVVEGDEVKRPSINVVRVDRGGEVVVVVCMTEADHDRLNAAIRELGDLTAVLS